MAVAIDPRPSYFGDRMIVTGTYAAADAVIELSGILASIDAAIVNATAPLAPQNLEEGTAADASDAAPFLFGEFATVSGTTISVNTPGAAQATIGGTFLAIGRRS
tara:strand:- start:411 stop:725 length:315 start_codon:yes stop_codon:yes gene_type:complete